MSYLAARFQERGSIGALLIAIAAITVSVLFVLVGHGDASLGITIAAISGLFAVLVLLIPEAENVAEDLFDEMHVAFGEVHEALDNLHSHIDSVTEEVEEDVVKAVEPAPVVASVVVPATVVAEPDAPISAVPTATP